MNMHQAILVFGGTGFIGSALVKMLLSKKITVLVFKYKGTGFLGEIKDSNLVYFDSFEELVLRKYSIDVLYHLASRLPDVQPTFADFYNANVVLTTEIIELAKELKVKQFVYGSTGSVFENPCEPIVFDENTRVNPLSYYGLTKYIVERLLEIELKECDIQVSIVRFPSVFGKNNSIGITKLFFDLAKKGDDIKIFSNGVRYRNLMHVNSAVDMLYKIYKGRGKLSKYEIFLAGSSDSVTILNISKMVVKMVKSKSKIIPVDEFPPSDFDVRIDISKAERILRFKPMSIEDGLKKYIEEEYEKI